MSSPTEPDEATKQAERDESRSEHTSDPSATDGEAAAADGQYAGDDAGRRADVARHEEEMLEIGADVKGEGAID